MSTQSASLLRLPALLLAGLLAACDTLVPLPSRPIVEQPNYGSLPGAGTYALVTGRETAKGARTAESPPLHDADGPAEGLMAPRTGADTLGRQALSPEDSRIVQVALAGALERRGYRPRPPQQAAWHVSVDSIREQRDEHLAPRDKMLLPRMRCEAQGCMVMHQWEHFGPPLRGESLRRYLIDVVEVSIRHGRSGDLAWRGRLSSEPGEEGHPSRHGLERALNRLMRKLPAVPRHNPLADPVEAGTAAP